MSAKHFSNSGYFQIKDWKFNLTHLCPSIWAHVISTFYSFLKGIMWQEGILGEKIFPILLCVHGTIWKMTAKCRNWRSPLPLGPESRGLTGPENMDVSHTLPWKKDCNLLNLTEERRGNICLGWWVHGQLPIVDNSTKVAPYLISFDKRIRKTSLWESNQFKYGNLLLSHVVTLSNFSRIVPGIKQDCFCIS